MNCARRPPFTTNADLVSILEASYLQAADVDVWFARLLEAFARSGLSSGGFFGHLFERKGRTLAFGSPRGSSDLSFDSLRCQRLLHAADLARFYDCPPCATLSFVVAAAGSGVVNLKRRLEVAALLHTTLRRSETRDLMGLRAEDGSGKGLLVCTPLTEPTTLERREIYVLRRILEHVSAGLRLQLASGPGGRARVEAVLGSSGRIEHAEGLAREPAARAALTRATKGVDRARGRLRRTDPEAATEEWNALVLGRWSLVDHFDHDGRRYLVARRNEQALPRCGDARLTVSERRVASLAALGRSNKLIAYELGLSTSGVSTHLSRISRKVGAGSRVELVGASAMLAEAG